MHPLLAGRLRLWLYVACWIPVAAMLAAMVGALDRPWQEAALWALPLTIVYAFVCLSAWWVCRALPLGAVPASRLLTLLFLASLFSSLLWTAIAVGWDQALARWMDFQILDTDTTQSLTRILALGDVLYLLSVVVHYLIAAFESARSAERRALSAQIAAREAELRALRAQVDPHFLFNSLNSVASLVGNRPEEARRICQRLGEFLRETLRQGGQTLIPLAQELALAERYLSIEQVRFGSRLSVVTAVELGAEQCMVPPLLLQPLVENAVNHGIAGLVEGGMVRIAARRSEGRLELEVENPRDDDAPARRGEGVGLANVRRRLEALDPRGTRCEVLREPKRFRVRLTLPELTEGADVLRSIAT